MRTITLEEHFATPRFLDGPGRDLKEQAEKFNNARALKLIPQLGDLGDKRIAEMDTAGIYETRTRTPSSLPNIRLSSDWANPLNRSAGVGKGRIRKASYRGGSGHRLHMIEN